MFDSAENIKKFTKFVTIAHHTKGRIRFKFDSAILQAFSAQSINELGNLEKFVNGIQSVSLNKLAKSATVGYDVNIIPSNTWERVIGGDVRAIDFILSLVLHTKRTESV